MEAVEVMAPEGHPLPAIAVHAPLHEDEDKPMTEPKKPGGHGKGETEAGGQKLPLGHTAQVPLEALLVAFE